MYCGGPRLGTARAGLPLLEADAGVDFEERGGRVVARRKIDALAGGKRRTGALVGMWVPSILLVGLYRKLAGGATLADYRADHLH